MRESSPQLAPPLLPDARGPLSADLLTVLRSGTGSRLGLPVVAEPWGDDAQLALYLCYELHYHGFAGVEPELEWDPAVLAFRRELERAFLTALRADAGAVADVDTELAGLLVEPLDAPGPSHYLLDQGQRWQVREYLAHRSLYQLKEADPHIWVVPRLQGQAKASMVAVQYDEYGAGRGEHVHALLYAQMMTAFGLDPGYGRYLDVVPAVTLATVNVMSLFGLHRALRGALVGQFAVLEITSPPGAERLLRAVSRFDGSAAATRFYDEHVEADAVHEQLVRRGVIGGLLATEPDLAPDIAFGIRAAVLLEDRLGENLVAAWRAGRSSLRHPLDDGPPG
ncbi:MAG TPA: iron-containing redox enzyme family protein [Pseudonocardiaceae bacterium]|nr:iron-containing redox enzyme family protein [Pseudonocardiaceae bacterium]